MPSATAREFQRVASQLGFVRRRQTGSHERWNHPDGRSVTIPLHGGREIGPPLFHKTVLAIAGQLIRTAGQWVLKLAEGWAGHADLARARQHLATLGL